MHERMYSYCSHRLRLNYPNSLGLARHYDEKFTDRINGRLADKKEL